MFLRREEEEATTACHCVSCLFFFFKCRKNVGNVLYKCAWIMFLLKDLWV
jgi:hypothetical protein